MMQAQLTRIIHSDNFSSSLTGAQISPCDVLPVHLLFAVIILSVSHADVKDDMQ